MEKAQALWRLRKDLTAYFLGVLSSGHVRVMQSVSGDPWGGATSSWKVPLWKRRSAPGRAEHVPRWCRGTAPCDGRPAPPRGQPSILALDFLLAGDCAGPRRLPPQEDEGRGCVPVTSRRWGSAACGCVAVSSHSRWRTAPGGSVPPRQPSLQPASCARPPCQRQAPHRGRAPSREAPLLRCSASLVPCFLVKKTFTVRHLYSREQPRKECSCN